MLKAEIKRAFLSRGMFVAVAAAIICILYKNIDYYIKLIEYRNAIQPGAVGVELNRQTFYSLWIVGNFFTPASVYIFYFMGLIAVVPYGVSYYRDKRNGIIKNMSIRAGKKSYLRAKFIAVFLSGGIAVLIPVLLDFMLTKIWIPHDFVYMPFTVLNSRSMWGVFMIDHIYISAVLTMTAWFVFGGTLATVALLVSVFVNDFFTIQLTPFFLMILLMYIPDLLPESIKKYFPYYFLSVFGDGNPIMGILISLTAVMVMFGIFYYCEGKKDIL